MTKSKVNTVIISRPVWSERLIMSECFVSLFDCVIAAFLDDFRCCEPSDWWDEKCYCLSEPLALIGHTDTRSYDEPARRLCFTTERLVKLEVPLHCTGWLNWWNETKVKDDWFVTTFCHLSMKIFIEMHEVGVIAIQRSLMVSPFWL